MCSQQGPDVYMTWATYNYILTKDFFPIWQLSFCHFYHICPTLPDISKCHFCQRHLPTLHNKLKYQLCHFCGICQYPSLLYTIYWNVSFVMFVCPPTIVYLIYQNVRFVSFVAFVNTPSLYIANICRFCCICHDPPLLYTIYWNVSFVAFVTFVHTPTLLHLIYQNLRFVTFVAFVLFSLLLILKCQFCRSCHWCLHTLIHT